MSRTVKIVGTVGLVLILLQFVPLDRRTPPVPPEADFLTANQVPEELARTIRSACYDCHSYQTKYPWYARVAPVSFWIQHHVNEGRAHLNFTTWTAYNGEKRVHKLEECWEEIENKAMPLTSYTWLHPAARLTKQQRLALVRFFQEMEFTNSVRMAR